MKAVLLVFLVFIAFSKATRNYEAEWEQFKVKHAKVYESTEEHNHRFNIFRANLDVIDQLNTKHNPHTYFGVNKLTDLSLEEYRRFAKDVIAPHHNSAKPVHDSHKILERTDIPTSVDWRKQGAVTAVYNQGQCGSSPYFSAIASLEGAWKIAGHPLIALSVQQVQDCAPGDYGCNGGFMTTSFQYIMNVGGIESNTSYPYNGGNVENCKFDKSKIAATMKNYVNISTGSDLALTQALARVPVATAVDAESVEFQMYKSGIFSVPCKHSNQPDHGIAAVGYGVLNGKSYYILKNSWGTDWGINGFMLIERNNNFCGVATLASYAVV